MAALISGRLILQAGVRDSNPRSASLDTLTRSVGGRNYHSANPPEVTSYGEAIIALAPWRFKRYDRPRMTAAPKDRVLVASETLDHYQAGRDGHAGIESPTTPRSGSACRAWCRNRSPR
jgi:hypothetical protein